MLLRSKQVCEKLGVPATTLRLWSNEFSDLLSESAQASISERGTPTQRKYTEADIELLTQVQSLLSVGLVYDAIREVLTNNPTAELSLPELVLQMSPNGHQTAELALPASLDLTEVTALLERSVALYEATLEKQDQLLKAHEETLAHTEALEARQEALLQQNVAIQQEILHELRARPTLPPPPTPMSFFDRLKALFL